jgi:PPK2 family polyphosphate:nucleotide phosphotransferase
MSKIAEKKVPPPHMLAPGETCHLDQFETCPPVEGREKEIEGWDKKSAQKRITYNAKLMADLARRLYAENRRSILLVLQGMDTAGKDGTIRSVMRGINPRSCQVHSFKKPSEEELDHDFLWRVHKVVPRKGNIGIFNRSHYEDVLIVRVLDLVPKGVWEPRFETINIFEKALTEGGMVIVKCCLHISNETQRERLQARIDDPNAHWKFNPEDIEQRKRWPDYQKAYEDAITRCNTAHAPWYIVPSDRKWYRNLIVSELLLSKLQEIDPQYPAAERDWTGIVVS